MIDDFSGGQRPKPGQTFGAAAAGMSGAESTPGTVPDNGVPQKGGGFPFDRLSDNLNDSGSEPTFKTPEQVSAMETAGHSSTQTSSAWPGGQASSDAPKLIPEHAKMSFKERLQTIKDWRPTRKQLALILAVALVLAGAGIAFAMSRHKPAPVTKPMVVAPPPKPAPTPAPILSPLTGMPVTADQQKRPVTAVMIENSPDARPQSGLDQAGIVFEAIAEAGITRFMALYQETDPSVVGPVRSSRPYYLDWAEGFDAAYAHVGGSPDALQKIRADGVKDLDQFYNSGSYHRVSTRYAPHNVYTSLDSLVSLEASKGWTSSSFTPLPRKPKETPAATPTTTSINIGISGAYYNVHYDYDKASNTYKRSEGGAIHIDNETKKQLSPKVVVVLAMPYSLMSDNYHSQYQTIGSGKMLVFQDGVVASGTWSKDSPKDQLVFKDDTGATLALDPGQTWITAVDNLSKVTHQ